MSATYTPERKPDLITVQFEKLAKKYPGATLQRIISVQSMNEAVVTLTVSLPSGWDSNIARVAFTVPRGYPHNWPTGFYASPDTRRTGTLPRNVLWHKALPCSAIDPTLSVYWPWRAEVWNANKDTLTTYAHLIEQRFREEKDEEYGY